MKILNAQQLREVDQETIKQEPISSIDLMERASNEFYKAFQLIHKDKNTPILIFAGTGNNGGDALAIARIMTIHHYNVNLYYLKQKERGSDDFETNLKRLMVIKSEIIFPIQNVKDFPIIDEETLVFDGLFGTGLNRAVDGIAEKLIAHINDNASTVFAIDIPSGLFCNDNSATKASSIIKATHTISFQLPKLTFLIADNQQFVGKLHIRDIGITEATLDACETTNYLIDDKLIKSIVKNRQKFSHKGSYGHALLIAGSYGKMGAATLASKACLRSGVGLLTTHVPHLGYNIIQISVPEAMASIDRSELMFTEFPPLDPFNAIGIGPGLGTKPNSVLALKELLQTSDKPMVIDADAINIISANPELLTLLPQNAILTPHPGEFARLVGAFDTHQEQIKQQQLFSEKHNVIIVLKGAHTTISLPDGRLYFNTTGNAGMATGGSGDVLTGAILGFLAQGYSAENATIIGVYLHGVAGNKAANYQSQNGLIASDIIDNLGAAFLNFQNV